MNYNIKTIIKNVFFFSLIFSCIVSYKAEAFSIYAKKQEADMQIGQQYLVKIYMDTEQKEINVVEGRLKINGAYEILSIDTSGSVLSMWTEEPTYEKGSDEIYFTGGVEGGVYGKDLRLLNLVIVPKAKGEITISPIEVVAYLNDGLGSKIDNVSSDIIFNTIQTRTQTTRLLFVILLMVILYTILNIRRKFILKINS